MNADDNAKCKEKQNNESQFAKAIHFKHFGRQIKAKPLHADRWLILHIQISLEPHQVKMANIGKWLHEKLARDYSPTAANATLWLPTNCLFLCTPHFLWTDA